MTDIEFLIEVRRIIKEEVAAYMGAVPSLQEPEEWTGTAAFVQGACDKQTNTVQLAKAPQNKKAGRTQPAEGGQ